MTTSATICLIWDKSSVFNAVSRSCLLLPVSHLEVMINDKKKSWGRGVREEVAK